MSGQVRLRLVVVETVDRQRPLQLYGLTDANTGHALPGELGSRLFPSPQEAVSEALVQGYQVVLDPPKGAGR